MTTLHDEFDQAIHLRDEGKPDEALAILSKLANEPNATAAVFAVLGSLQWERGALRDAVSSFRNATDLSPRSEVASLGLFHTLLEWGQDDEAFDEMRRYLSVGKSEEYQALLNDINRSSDK